MLPFPLILCFDCDWIDGGGERPRDFFPGIGRRRQGLETESAPRQERKGERRQRGGGKRGSLRADWGGSTSGSVRVSDGRLLERAYYLKSGSYSSSSTNRNGGGGGGGGGSGWGFTSTSTDELRVMQDEEMKQVGKCL